MRTSASSPNRWPGWRSSCCDLELLVPSLQISSTLLADHPPDALPPESVRLARSRPPRTFGVPLLLASRLALAPLKLQDPSLQASAIKGSFTWPQGAYYVQEMPRVFATARQYAGGKCQACARIFAHRTCGKLVTNWLSGFLGPSARVRFITGRIPPGRCVPSFADQ